MASSSLDEDSDTKRTTIVLDTGSDMTKIGFAGDEAPTAVFETVVGYPKVQSGMVGVDNKDAYVSDEVHCIKRDILNLNRPMEKGIVTDWDAIEKLWHHSFFNILHVDPVEYKVLLTENVADDDNRQKMIEIMLETFKVPGVLIALQSALSLYTYGRVTGIVLDSGYEATNVTPIYEGDVVQRSMKRMEFGGKHISNNLEKLLSKRGYHFTTDAEKRLVRDIKERLCRLSSTEENWAKEDSVQVNYELPDGNVIKLQGEQFNALRPLFHPCLIDGIDPETPGIHTALNDSIYKCWPDPHPRHFLRDIVLSGGNTMYDGIKERLTNEMTKIIPQAVVAKINVIPERKHSVWIGGSILASLPSVTEDKWISSAEYEEFGAEVVRRKCGVIDTGGVDSSD